MGIGLFLRFSRTLPIFGHTFTSSLQRYLVPLIPEHLQGSAGYTDSFLAVPTAGSGFGFPGAADSVTTCSLHSQCCKRILRKAKIMTLILVEK